MTTYRNIASTETDPQAPITSALMKALDDNVTAAFDGDATAAAEGVTLKDPALDTGAATAAGIAWVGLRTAGLAAGAVGSYGLFRRTTPADAEPGSTIAGSSLAYTNAEGDAGAPSVNPSGTWRLMGNTRTGTSHKSTSVFLRIS